MFTRHALVAACLVLVAQGLNRSQAVAQAGFWPPPPADPFFKPQVPDGGYGFRFAPTCIGPNVDCGGCGKVRENLDPMTDKYKSQVSQAIAEIDATTVGILGPDMGGNSHQVFNVDAYWCKMFEILCRMGLDPVDGGFPNEVNIIGAGDAMSYQYGILSSANITRYVELAYECPLCAGRPTGFCNGVPPPVVTTVPPPTTTTTTTTTTGGGGGGGGSTTTLPPQVTGAAASGPFTPTDTGSHSGGGGCWLGMPAGAPFAHGVFALLAAGAALARAARRRA